MLLREEICACIKTLARAAIVRLARKLQQNARKCEEKECVSAWNGKDTGYVCVYIRGHL